MAKKMGLSLDVKMTDVPLEGKHKSIPVLKLTDWMKLVLRLGTQQGVML